MKEVLNGRQSFRNPNLVYVLNKFNYIENYVTGLKKTLAAYEKYSVKPKYEPTDNFFVVLLPNVTWNNIVDTNDTNVGVNVESDINDVKNVGNDTNVSVKLTSTQKFVLKLLSENGSLSTSELANAIGRTQRTIQRVLIELKDKKYIERIGSTQTGYWKVLKK